jgi:hypothetical protein
MKSATATDHCFQLLKHLVLLFASALFIFSACTPVPISVPPEVSAIINEKCAGCHSVKLIPLPALAYLQYKGGCGGCHVPFTAGHDTANCTSCHSSPDKTHFYLRDEQEQTTLSSDAESACITCHLGDFHKMGKGFPPLTNDEEIIKYAQQGTLRQWIQPGGAMAKYVTSREAATLTRWIDKISKNRPLGYDPYLDAVKIANDFEINGKGDNAFWATAPEHIVELGPTLLAPVAGLQIPQVDGVKLKALYSKRYLYIRAEYRDATLNMTRAGAWIYDAATKEWGHPPVIKPYGNSFPAAEVYDKQAEDGLALMWNISIPDYKTTYGCAIKCHGNVPGASCFTDKRGATADIWHAKAASGLAALSIFQEEIPGVSVENGSYEVTEGKLGLSGCAEDRYLIWYMDLADGYNTVDAGRIVDEGMSAYTSNQSADRKCPRYMEKHPDSYADAMVLTQQEIDDGEALVTDPDDPQFTDIKAVETAWADYAAVNALVPELILKSPAGSRSDVGASASWENGVWVYELKRKLLNGNADDAQFFPVKNYEFSIAVFNNCGWGEIPPMHNTYGNGQYQIMRFKK